MELAKYIDHTVLKANPWCAGTGAPGRASVPVAVWDSADGKAVMPGSDSDVRSRHPGGWWTGQGDGNARCSALGEVTW